MADLYSYTRTQLDKWKFVRHVIYYDIYGFATGIWCYLLFAYSSGGSGGVLGSDG